MPVFAYTGRTRQGQTVSGEMEASNPEAVVSTLRRQQIITTSVKAKARDIQISIPGFGGKVSEKEVAIFTRQFSTMIDAGLPLVQSLEILASQQDNKAFQKVLVQIRQDVEGGATLAAALKKQPKTFTDLYANMVEAGEAGGILDTILNRLAAYIEKSISLKKKVKSAMIYPSTIVSVALVVVTFLLLFVIPTFKSMFEGFGATLPLPTRIILELSRLVRQFFIPVIIAFVGMIIGLRYYYKTEKGRKVIDTLLLKAPVFGMLLRKVAVAKFTRTLGTLISSGVAILDGLEITARTAGNKVVEEAIMKTRVSIAEGKTIAAPLKETTVFPPMVVQMIAVGEQTGALDSMLSKIADFYDDEVDTTVSNLTSLLEPLLMVFLGVVVGGVVIAMYLPIFKLVTVVGK
ncbi:MAG: type II secretion system F family protein [bacterium]